MPFKTYRKAKEICLEEQEKRISREAAHGKLNPRECGKQSIWTIKEYLRRKKEVEVPGFSVDILIDASLREANAGADCGSGVYFIQKSETIM